jgi:amino acid transporter
MHLENRVWLAAGIGIVGIAINNASSALSGASQALMFSEDMRSPQKIGRTIMVAFALTVVLETVPVAGAIVGAHDLKAVLTSDAPYESFLGQYLPGFTLRLISLSIAVAIFNACLAGFIGTGRNLFTMGRTRLFASPINQALTRLTPRARAHRVAIAVVGLTTACATCLPMTAKLLLLSGNHTITTIFYIWDVVAGRRSGRTCRHSYRTPLFALIPALGVFIVIGEIVALWLDADTGRKSLFMCKSVFTLAYLYYSVILLRRPDGWIMTGPTDIDETLVFNEFGTLHPNDGLAAITTLTAWPAQL